MTRPKKTLAFLLPAHWDTAMGGAEYQVSILIKKLVAANNFHIYYLARLLNPASTFDGYTTVKIADDTAIRRRGFFFDFRRIYKVLREIRPDILYQRVGCSYTGIAAYYAKRHNCKLIWHISIDSDVIPRAREYARNFVFPFIEKRFLEYGITNAPYIIAQTDQQRMLLQENYGRRPVAIIPNWHPIPQGEIVKTNPIKIVWTANFKQAKRPELFVKLAQDLDHLQNVEFIMIGSTFSHRRWTKLLEEGQKSLHFNFKYLGHLPQEEVNATLAKAHIFVNTSHFEGFPNTFIQAWMRKVPVVSLSIDPDGVLNSEGIGFLSGSYENLRRDVTTLVKDPKLRSEMGDRAQAYAFRTHSETNLRRVIELIDE